MASSAQRDDESAFDQAPPGAEGGDGSPSSKGTDKDLEDLEELRRLLLTPEQQRLHLLEQREIEIDDISRVLPDAVARRAGEDHQLALALGPTIEETLRVSIQRNPHPFADALFPVIGPAIRKSIREALRSLLETINRTVESRFSPRAVKWQFEAWRTGLTFSEVMLRHTLHYRVEQVFLVHEETGLPLQHVVAEAVDAQDGSLVTSMLTAIEDFAKDSFGTRKEDTLDALEIGELTVWIAQGPRAYLAAVIRGIPSPELRLVLEDVIETIHLHFRDALEAFDGDADPLADTRPMLESVLVARFKEQVRRTSPVLWGLLASGAAALLIWLFFSFRDRARWNAYLAMLDAEPGLVVTDRGRDGGTWYVQGLRDPLARDPADLLAETSLDPAEVRGTWAFYQTLDSAFVLQRAVNLLVPPPTVVLGFEDGTLSASGTAPPDWIAQARQQARFVAGVTAYDDAALDDTFADLVETLERQVLRFVGGSATLAEGQEAALDSLIAHVQRFERTVQITGRSVRLQILGHVSTEGDPNANQSLSLERAEAVRDVLIQRGLPPSMVEAIGTGRPRFEGEEQTEAERAANRSVSFHVVVS